MNHLHTIEEQETAAYMAGDTRTADLLARMAELEAQVLELEDKLAEYDYVQFFNGCFERLKGHYPNPSISSDYDKSVIFAAIEDSEAGE